MSLVKSLLRKNTFTKSSSKPMSSSVISNNPSSSKLLITLCTKYHYTAFINPPPPPQIPPTPGYHFRKYSFSLLKLPKDSGEATAECNFDDDLLKEIAEIDNKIDEARDWIAVGNEDKNCFMLWPYLEEEAVRARGAVKIASDEVNALVAKLGHDTEKPKAHQCQLRRLGERIQSLNEDLDKFVDFSKIHELEAGIMQRIKSDAENAPITKQGSCRNQVLRKLRA